ncbi:hypothetical protein H2248_001522 [Termitomyces sp. 'cryptogamus']|nr:hypothetical protein H2248_001522 [Termitomyces sp. 'cryptogamus']
MLAQQKYTLSLHLPVRPFSRPAPSSRRLASSRSSQTALRSLSQKTIVTQIGDMSKQNRGPSLPFLDISLHLQMPSLFGPVLVSNSAAPISATVFPNL